MPDEIVTIRVDFETNERDMAAVLAELRGFSQGARNAERETDRLSRSTRRLDRDARRLDEPMAAMKKRYTDLERAGQRFNKTMSLGDKLKRGFAKSARFLLLQMIALVAEFVITAATLASVNLLFKLGQWAMKGYNLALGVVGAALSTVAVAATTAVAAFREFNAAAAAWQYKGANVYGSATGAAAAAMRNLSVDANLATMGVQQLTSAYKAMSAQGRVTGQQTKALSGAMDFVARSPDQGKSFQAMANFVATLSKEGKLGSKSSAAATNVSKEFAEAVKKSKKKDSASILAAMTSGQLAKDAGVGGEFTSIKGTLVSQFKAITVTLTQDMSDFGDQFLNQTRVVLDGLFKNVRNVLARLAPEFAAFGKGKLFPAITTIGNSLEKFSVMVVRKYMPMLDGATGWFRRTFDSFRKSFNQFKHSLEKFREGSRIITETFKGPIFAVFRIFGQNAEKLGYLAQDNEEQFKAWGGALENLILAIGDWFSALKVAFTEALPVLTQIVNVLSKLISGMASLVRGIGTFRLGGGEGFMGLGGTGGGPSGTVGGGLGAGVGTLMTLGLMFGAFKGRRFAYRQQRMGSIKDESNMASMYAARSTRGLGIGDRLFGGIPTAFSRAYYSKDAGRRLTPAEYAAMQARYLKLGSMGYNVGTPEEMMNRMGGTANLAYGTMAYGIGGNRAIYDPRTGQRVGFSDLGQYRSYMTGLTGRGGTDLRNSVNSQALMRQTAAAEAAARATPGFANMKASKQEKLLQQARDDAAANHMRTLQAQRDQTFGQTNFRTFLFGGTTTGMDAQGGTSVTGRRLGIFQALSGKRFREERKDIARARILDARESRLTGTTVTTRTDALDPSVRAREQLRAELMRQDQQGLGKYVDRDTGQLRSMRSDFGTTTPMTAGYGPGGATRPEDATARQKAARRMKNMGIKIRQFRSAESKMDRLAARKAFTGMAKAQFAGVGESAQASLRKTFNPMMGMMGGMLLSTGVTNKIGDKDFRGAAESALGMGAMFGGRGMAIAGGLKLMQSTSSKKAALGGMMAGAAVGKTIADSMGPLLQNPMAKYAIIAGSALIGGVVGVFKAQGNREKEMRKKGQQVGRFLQGEFGAALVGAKVDKRTGKLVQGDPSKGFQRAIQVSEKQNKLFDSLGIGDYQRAFEKRGLVNTTTGENYTDTTRKFQRDIVTKLYKSGKMTKADFQLAQEYMKQSESALGNAGAMKSLDSMIVGASETYFGKGSAAGMTRAEDFFYKGGTADRMAPKRGALYLSADQAANLGVGAIQDMYAKRGNFAVQHLSQVLNMTEADLMKLASTMDVNLGDPTKSLTEHLTALGKATRKTINEVRQSVRDLQISSLSSFDEEIQKRDTVQAYTAATNNLIQAGGGAGIKDFQDYIRTYTLMLQQQNPDNQFAVLDALKDFSQGNLGALGSMSAEQRAAFAKNGQSQAETAYKTQVSGMADLAVSQFQGGLLEKDLVFQNLGANEKLKGFFRRIFESDTYSSSEKNNLMNLVSTGQLIDKSGGINYKLLSGVGSAGQALSTMIGGEGNLFATETSKVYEISGDVGLKGEALDALNELNQRFSTAFDASPEAWEGKTPQWWSDMQKYQWKAEGNTLKLVEGDTKTSRRGRVGDTPTSRAHAATMGAHARFNSMLTGKRNVTSSLRFDNLGSLSSDHAAGRAYDLTGDNLGQYQQLINKAGGFAEFHGWAGSRHLHVVPPIGNTRTSRVTMVADRMERAAAPGPVTVNVYGAKGQSESEIARQVVSILESERRAYRERS